MTRVGLERSLGPYFEVTIPSGSNCSEAIGLQASAFGGFLLPAAVDAVNLRFAPQEHKDDALSSWELARLDGTLYECVQVANQAYALPGALFGHYCFRFKLASGNAGADRVILVHLGN